MLGLLRLAPIITMMTLLSLLITGATYNIPIIIWLQKNFPQNNPIVFVTPTPDMSINTSQYVDGHGRVYMPYITEWKQVSWHGGLVVSHDRNALQTCTYRYLYMYTFMHVHLCSIHVHVATCTVHVRVATCTCTCMCCSTCTCVCVYMLHLVFLFTATKGHVTTQGWDKEYSVVLAYSCVDLMKVMMSSPWQPFPCYVTIMLVHAHTHDRMQHCERIDFFSVFCLWCAD